MFKFIFVLVTVFCFGSSFAGSVKPPGIDLPKPSYDLNFFHQEWCWYVTLDVKLIVRYMKSGRPVSQLYIMAQSEKSISPARRGNILRLITDYQNAMRKEIEPDTWGKNVVTDCIEAIPKSTLLLVQSEPLKSSAESYWGFEKRIPGCLTNMGPAMHRCVLAFPEFRFNGVIFSEADIKKHQIAYARWQKTRSMKCNVKGVIAYYNCLGKPPQGVEWWKE